MNNSAASHNDHGKDGGIGDIFSAIDALDIKLIESILKNDINVLYEFSQERGQYPITYACKVGNLTPASKLLEYLDENDEFTQTMLWESYLNARRLGHKELVKSVKKKMFGWSEFSDPVEPSP